MGKILLIISIIFSLKNIFIKNTDDDTKNLQTLLNQKNIVEFPANTTYKINGTLYLKNGQKILGNHATIIQTAPGKPIFDCVGKKDISISQINLKGYGNDYSPTSSSPSVGILCFGAENVKICDNNFYNFSYSPASGLRKVKNVLFENNYCEGIGLNNPKYYQKDVTGITLGGEDIRILNNRITNSSQGIMIAEGSKNITIKDNQIYNLPLEHGIYVDASCSDIIIENNKITKVNGSGIKIQNRSKKIPPGISKNILIKNNTVSDTGLGDGILFNNTEGNEVYAENVTITGNILKNIGQDGINIRFSKNSKVLDNQILTSKRSGIYLKENYNLTIYKNTIENIQQNGIFDEGSGTNIVMDSNTITNIGLAGNDKNGLSSGIFIQSGNNRQIVNNYLKGNPKYTQYSLYIPDGDQKTIIIKNNKFIGARDSGARFSEGKVKFKEFTGNQFDSQVSGSKILNQPNQ
ncbi:right-handed parallel beta-helix repeat-containing protein [Chryseobacterium indologenes]|uniref:Right-handed parallel beta-helix repeat-containing protein n=1 Tax=Chryseobacterium indologenes TaxID=253 RepID=A0AAD0YSM4_CHRID|nr:right-handed parallel beta-helix repeat-containing protein [Chryseobacterium indologenes]ATN06274.1 right-handed parallel beta-helix repeat-containing protein [Chryseobacterium indologenes]AYY84964.1 right-handed parallel beta-helix repeat-containing protein [Chryseobacterium indologenes]AYZ34635.1 right-handed parallel beta-helix repeat-containing protein [Chryseobacterium indologenes]AZB18154.1 right-handed parallel beta-helix repeat-containing protein [Chryseobacterium indologenes]MBF664